MSLTSNKLHAIIKNYFSDIKGFAIPIHIVTVMYGKDKLSVSMLENNIDSCIEHWSLPKIKSVLDQLDLYYYNGESLVSDSCYDRLSDHYYNKTKKPRIKIGAPITGTKVKLPLHMGSMDKVKPGSSELKNFLQKYTNEKCIMDKLDGTSLLLDIRIPGNPKAYTRGDSTYGRNISDKIPYIKGLEKLFDCSLGGFIRGELIIPKIQWAKMKDQGANARNYVSGAINRKSIDAKQLHNITFVAYEWSGEVVDARKLSISQQLDILKEASLVTVRYARYPSILEPQLPPILTQFRDTSVYEIDGIIVQDNVYHSRNTSKNPKYAKAFKMDSMCESAITTVKKLIWVASKSGAMKPVVQLEPVHLAGVCIQRASAYNANFVEKHGIGTGAKVKIIRSGDVIPKIVEVIHKVTPDFPTVPYVWDTNHTEILLTNKAGSSDVAIKQLEHFVSTMGIAFFKSGIIKKAYAKGCTSIYDLLYINKDQLMKYGVEGIKDKSASKIADSIKNAFQQCTVGTLAAATPYFDGMGKGRMNAIHTNIPNWLELPIEEVRLKVISLEGFSEITWKRIMAGMEDFKKFYKAYLDVGFCGNATVETAPPQQILSNALEGRVFMLTGFRNKDLCERIKQNGGTIVDSLTKKNGITDLIVKDTTLSNAKTSKAIEMGLNIIALDQLMAMIH
jgi:DNA ligase (NAD+)